MVESAVITMLLACSHRLLSVVILLFRATFVVCPSTGLTGMLKCPVVTLTGVVLKRLIDSISNQQIGCRAA